ncbi:MAG: STAS domain-containing protein [Thiotrichaceae bacterium]|nr:STAS domain-containing protein [Thiotrichaceae bacterium]
MTQSVYCLKLPTTLTLTQLHALQIECQQHPSETLQIDAEAVEHVDTAALQLLLAVSQVIHIEWENPSLVLCAAAQTLGLTQLLKLPPINV